MPKTLIADESRLKEEGNTEVGDWLASDWIERVEFGGWTSSAPPWENTFGLVRNTRELHFGTDNYGPDVLTRLREWPNLRSLSLSYLMEPWAELAALPHLRAKIMKPIAITGRARHPLLPEVPTFEEAGFRDYDAVQWYGIVGPARLPAELTRRLNAGINKAITTPALRDRLAREAIDAMPMSPEQFGDYIRSEIARWTQLARERKITVEE